MKKDKLLQLKSLEKEMTTISLPLSESNLVFGEGNPDCVAMFIGEAPGLTEEKMKRPFVGRAGRLLDRLIDEIGWKRSDIYITNIVKRRPPENRAPRADEIEAYKPYLARQIEIISPHVIVTLGRFATNYFLPESKISHDHGRIRRVEGRIIFPLYHPAAALRSTKTLDVLRSDLRKLPNLAAGINCLRYKPKSIP
jgi:DNA polymerase